MNDHGLTEKDLAFLELVIKQELGSGATGKVWLFGSRAIGAQKKHSDVDLLIECEILSGPIVSRMNEVFEESDFPYKVDIVDLRKLAAAYAPSVMHSRRLLFEL